MKRKNFIIIAITIAAVALPISAWAQNEVNRSPSNAPPVGQALIPEGAFAVELVQTLQIGQVQDEAQAESMLSALGIEPKNGWIGGYPVTPAVIGEIEESVAKAADSGKLKLDKAQAVAATKSLESRLGLGITAAGTLSSSAAPKNRPPNTTIFSYTDKDGVLNYTDRYENIPKEFRGRVTSMEGHGSSPPYSANPVPVPPSQEWAEPPGNVTEAPPQPEYYPPPEVVNNYYYETGPPVITYYPPPQPYEYLYSWVPYPFWWSGFYFSGFFILHDFHRHIFFHGSPCLVTNHVAHGQRVFVVDSHTGNLRSSQSARGVYARQFSGERKAGNPAGVSRTTPASRTSAPSAIQGSGSGSGSRWSPANRPDFRAPTEATARQAAARYKTSSPTMVARSSMPVTPRASIPAGVAGSRSQVFSAHAAWARSAGGFRGSTGSGIRGGSSAGMRGHR